MNIAHNNGMSIMSSGFSSPYEQKVQEVLGIRESAAHVDLYIKVMIATVCNDGHRPSMPTVIWTNKGTNPLSKLREKATHEKDLCYRCPVCIRWYC